MFQDFSSAFPLKDRTLVNLNNGTLGLSPQSVLENQCQEIISFEKNTTISLDSSWHRLWLVQKELALFLGASPYDLFLRPNVTIALNDVLMGLSLPVKSEILTCSFEYGAIVNILKFKAQKEDLELRHMNFDFSFAENLTDEIIVQEIANQVSSKTSMVVLSHIFTGTGFCLPINKIGKKLRELGILFVVDGAHGPGMLPLHLDKDYSDVDFYTGNLHKWFLGPKGTAFAWVHPSKQSLLQNVYGSWTVFQSPEHMLPFAEGKHFASRMLWSHSQSFPVYYALHKSFEFWNEHGASTIQNEIALRCQFVKNELLKLGLSPVVRTEKYQTALLCYELSAFSEDKFIASLVMHAPPEKPLMVGLPKVPQKKILRLTPHIHNDLEELQSAIKTLKACLK